MLVSHQYNFIYTKTVKTGGTSVESYFEIFCMDQKKWRMSHSRDESVSEHGIIGFRGPKKPDKCIYWNHMSAAEIKKKIGDDIWNNYFKFCVIRNPYEKVISAFYHYNRENVGFGDILHDKKKFHEWLFEEKDVPIDRDKYLLNEKFCLDDVIRYERIQSSIKKICKKLNLPFDKNRIPTFKSGVRPQYATAQAIHSDETKKIVEKIYSFELDFFEYSFPTV